MARKGRKNEESKYDQNIIDALLRLKTPIIGVNGRKFSFRERARKETGLEHIAKKDHRLKVRDIESIPAILAHPKLWGPDSHNKIYRNYYGVRKGEEADCLLKIVTSPVKGRRDFEEVIITVFPVKTIKSIEFTDFAISGILNNLWLFRTK